MTEARPTRIVLVDDHVLVRQGIRGLISAEPDLEVVGEAGDSSTAVAVVAETQPDVVLLDVEIVGDEVTVTVARMLRLPNPPQILILSMYDGRALLRRLLELGIRGYLLKSAAREELLAAVRSARIDDGRIILGVSRASLAAVEGHDLTGCALSPRERDVLALASLALSNAQIATRLEVTEATVKRHLSNVFIKLGAVSRIDAVNKAVSASLIDPPTPGGRPARDHGSGRPGSADQGSGGPDGRHPGWGPPRPRG